jgi:Na+/H+ antiporter NhaD/arsenite permease-like protein
VYDGTPAQVVMNLMGTNKQYVVCSCISTVVACNAGGVVSPFGDVTSLMVWQKGKLSFLDFLKLLLPAVVNWLVPAFIMVR